MQKIIGSSLITIFLSFLILLSEYLLIEEILGFYILPIILVIVIATIPFLIIRIFKTISYKKFITNSLIVACALQISIVILILWSATPRYFSREQVIKDIDYSIKVMEDVHPNLYSSISKEVFYLKADSIKGTLAGNVSDADAFKTLRKLFSQIKDGHTGGGSNFFSNRRAGFFRKMLPYKIDVRNERLFISDNYCYRNIIPVGSEIIKINGKSSEQCLNEVSQLISYEIIPFRNSILQLPLFWSLWNDYKDFEITYKAPDSNILKTIKTSGGFMSKILFLLDYKSKGKTEDFSYKNISDNIGYIEFNSFSDLDKFKIFLDSTFESIKSKNVTDLIIDIRNNGGGNSELGDELMQYISKTNFRMFDSCLVKLSHELNEKRYFDYIDSTKRIVGTIYNSTDSSKTILRENPLRFKGNVYLLISGYTFSSATNLASAFQCYNVGRIIGTESGGLTACYGELYTFDLPNTKLDMQVSNSKFVSACGVDNKHGVIPDFILETSFCDQQKGIDKVMDFTIDLIKNDKD